jgi:hypothetical protein
LVLYWQPLASIFSFTPLSIIDWIEIIGISLAGALFVESTKLVNVEKVRKIIDR